MKQSMRGFGRISVLAGLVASASMIALTASAIGQTATQSVLTGMPFALVPTNFMLMAIAGGGLMTGLVALFVGARRRATFAQHNEALVVDTQNVREQLDDARALLSAEPHLMLLWRGAADEAPVVSGALPDEFELPERLDDQLNFSSWLERNDGNHLAAAITELKVTGTPFNVFVRTLSGGRLTADGFAAGGKAALKLKPLHGDTLNFIEIGERNERLDLELSSLKSGLDASPQPMWLRGPDGELIWVNNAYSKIVGAASPAEAVSGNLELASSRVRDKAVAAVQSGEISRQRIHTGKGRERHTFEATEVPAPLGSAGVATDATQLNTLQEDLDDHIAAHGRTLDRLTTAVAIFDRQHKLKFFNTAYANLWDLDGNWLRQEPKEGEVLDHLRDQGRLEERADYRDWRKKHLAAYRQSEPANIEWHLPDGRSLRVMTEPHPAGGLTYLFEDVTEKLALEAQYNRLLSVRKETLDNLHEGVVLYGSDGRLKLYNPSFAIIWNLGIEMLDTEPHMDTVIAACTPLTGDDDHWDELRRSITASGDERMQRAGRMERADGMVINYATVPLPDGATLFTYVDTTDGWRIEQALRERNEALVAADQLKTAFLSHVSYELRAPLTSIMGFAEFLATGAVGELTDKQSEYIGHIQRASADLHDLINDVIDLATIDAGAMELDIAPVDVSKLLQDAITGRIHERAEAAGLTIVLEADPGAKTFNGDMDRLQQVLYHLLSNAVGFSSKGGKITAGAKFETDEVVIFVRDQGRGIDPKVQDRIFERFETHSEGTSHRGTGLGLTIVKALVELHQGEVEIDSTPGQGTVVRCRFPLNPSPRPQNGPPVGHTTSPALDQNAPLLAPQH